MKRLIALLFIIPFMAFAQEKGISFEHHTTWEKVKAKAKAENKHIFVDCFTTWCGPCKWMAENVFPDEEAGKFFNANFVNLKVQMDQTDGDSDDVKSWYTEANRFAKDYEINAYPSFLIFNPNGELVHRIVGGAEVQEFIAKAKEGLNPETQLVTIKRAYTNNPNDKELAKKYAKVALQANDQEEAGKAFGTMIKNSSVDEILKEEYAELIFQTSTSSTSPTFQFVSNNRAKVDAFLQGLGMETTSNDILASAILSEEVYPKLQGGVEDVNLATLQSEIEKKHAGINFTKQFDELKFQFAMYTQNWKEVATLVGNKLKNKVSIDPTELNEVAWTFFEQVDDKALLTQALSWSKISIDVESENPAYLDTYANLLHKTGDTVNAIKWQEKALSFVDDEDKAAFQETLSKMKSGKPTW